MRVDLVHMLLETGLLQFGSFADSMPFHLSLEMLPAYPDVLGLIVTHSKSLLNKIEVNRLLCTADSVPFGVGLSLEMNIPLVYSRGSTDAPVYDLVGAYDIGHPALLLTNVLNSRQSLLELIANARQVGLEIQTVLTICDLRITNSSRGVEQISLLHLPDVIIHLVSTEQIPTGQAKAVQSWIANFSQREC